MTTLFEQNSSSTPDPVDENKDYLTELVGEGKKFKTPQELARGKAEADAFIDRMKAEMQELRNELNAKLKLEELVNKLENPQTQQKEPLNSNDGQQTREQEVPKGLSPTELEAFLESKLNEREANRIQQTNIDEVKKTLYQSFGNDYVRKLNDKAEELGVSKAFLDNLAKTQPKALYKLLDLAEGQTIKGDVKAPLSSVRVETFKPNVLERTKTYYDELKRTDKSRYWSPAIQNQMHNDAIRLGERFFDTT